MLVLYWLIAIMPLDQHPIWGRELVATFTLVKLIGLVCFLIALGHCMATGTPRFFRTPQARWFGVFFIMLCLSYPIQGGQLANGVMAYSHVFSIASLFFAVVVLVDSEQRLRRCLLVAIGAVGFTSLHAIRQWQLYRDVYPGLRPSGMLGDSNELALVVGLWAPLAFLLAFSRQPAWQRLFSFGCFVLMLIASTFAASRGGFLGLAAALLFLLWHSHHRLRNLAIVSAIAVPLLVLSPISPWHRLTQPGYGDNLAKEARLIAWKAGLRMIYAHPLTGVGLHNFKPLVARYEDPGDQVVSLAHNTYIEIGAELGVAAGLVFLIGLLVTLRSLGRLRRRARLFGHSELSLIGLGLQAGLISYTIGACFATCWWQKMMWLLVFLTVSLHRVSSVPPVVPTEQDESASDGDGGEEPRSSEVQGIAFARGQM